MARKSYNNNLYGFPGLFDEPGPGTPEPGIQLPAPELPHVGTGILSGGITPAPQGKLHPLGPVVVKPVPNKITFISFGSGSSGNCAYIGDSTAGFLIDAGVDAKTVLDGLAANNIPITNV